MTTTGTVAEREPAYGWVMVAIAFTFSGMGFGGLTSIGVFLKPLSSEFGWTRGDISLAYTLAGLAAIAGVLWGWLADRHGTRLLALAGTIGMAAALALLSRQGALWQFYLTYALFGLLGNSVYSGVIFANVGHWFSRNKGLALGAASAGGALGQAVIPYLVQIAIIEGGWRSAYVAMAVGYAVIGIPLALLVRDPPSRRAAARGEAMPRHDFPLPARETALWIGPAAFFCCVCMAVPIIHLVPLAIDQGIHPLTAAGVLTVLMVTATVGRLLGGKLADRVGALKAYAITSFGQTVLVIWFPFMNGIGQFYALSVIFGLIYAGVMTSILVCVREMVPVQYTARSAGVVTFLAWCGMGFGGYQGGLMFDLTGDYVWSYLNAGIAGVINLAVLAALSARIRIRRGALQAT